jgi:hypothetical protein
MTKEETAFLKRLKEIAKMINECEDIEIPTVKIPPKSTLEAAEKIIEKAIDDGMETAQDVDLFPDEIIESANDLSDEIVVYKSKRPKKAKEPVKEPEEQVKDIEEQFKEPEEQVIPVAQNKKRGPKKTKKSDKNEKDKLIATLFNLLPQTQIDELKVEDMRGILKAMK